MPRFSNDQIKNDLRKILLVQADHLANMANETIAAQFIGFALDGDGRHFAEADPARIDLERFHITSLLESCYEYAVNPSVLNRHDDSCVQDLQGFVLGIPEAAFDGEIYLFLTDKGVCQTVAELSLARFKLDNGDHLSSREVALLANITEGAVRNALADKSDSGLRAEPNTKNPIMIGNAEALRWLMGRRSFVPTPKSFDDDRYIAERVLKSRSSREIGEILARLSSLRFGSSEEVSRELGWDEDTFDAWCAGLQEFNETEAVQLAKALGIDVPLFVGKVRETTLRRDLSVQEEGVQ